MDLWAHFWSIGWTVLLVAVLATPAICWIIAVVQVSRSSLSDGARVGWALVTLIPILGPVLWWAIGRPAPVR
ncbi:PLDc N-terminal domain-containing protein [Agromyces sp. Leaf222]|uniref:PLDc N-terminal domain-containing protein n=1 Tax=Agromyces sp. Leaf222 TaxID=1735688 RepID=UPI0006F9DE33|nr:hypothetical protein ASE68_10635 [Agromyces sp. Leaf222]